MSNLITMDYDDLSGWSASRNDETYTTTYTKSNTAFDGKGESTEFLTIKYYLEDALEIILFERYYNICIRNRG